MWQHSQLHFDGKMEKETEQVFILKKKELYIKGNGWMTKNMVKDILNNLMEMKYLANGNMIGLMEWLKLDIRVNKNIIMLFLKTIWWLKLEVRLDWAVLINAIYFLQLFLWHLSMDH